MCIRDRHTAVYHPQSNQAERVMREIGRIFRAYCHTKHSEWPRYVKNIEDWLNCTTHESTGFTSYELIKGTRPSRILEQLFNYPPENNTIDVNIKLQLANENLLTKGEKRRHDSNGKWTKYEVDQLVLVRRHDLSSAQDKEIKKFFLLYEGPYEIIEVKMDNVYVLHNQVTREIVGTHNATNLKIYWSN